jgi:alpha-L-rhamnosidase
MSCPPRDVLDKVGYFYTATCAAQRRSLPISFRHGGHCQARFTFFGSALNDRWPEGSKAENFNAIVVHSDMKRTGQLNAAANGNQLYHNMCWGRRAIFWIPPHNPAARSGTSAWLDGDAQACVRATPTITIEPLFP